METRTTGRERCLVYLLGALFAFLVMRYGFCASSASMHLRADYDLNIYYLIGNGWMRGLLPYVDLTDLKGPLVFLLHGLGSLMTPGSFLGICILNALVVGVGLLYAYMTARLFLPVRGGIAVIGLYTYFLLYFAGHPAELVWSMQHVLLYIVMKRAADSHFSFGRVHDAFIGASAAAVLMLKFNLVAFWIPICFYAAYEGRLRSVFWQMLGGCVVVLPFLVYFWCHGALQAWWHEYVEIACEYGSVEWAKCALAQKNFELFRGIMPYHLYKVVPAWILAIPGCIPCLLWPLLWLRKDAPLRKSVLLLLMLSFVLLAYASYSGWYDFLHYAFVFYPCCLLSLIWVVRWMSSRSWLLLCLGLSVAASVLFIALALPLYVQLFRPFNGNPQIQEASARVVRWIQERPMHDVCVLDAQKLLHLYRLSGRLPSIRHFIPALVEQGEQMRDDEMVAYISRHKPGFLIGSVWQREKEAALIARTGVKYRLVSHAEWELPAYPEQTREYEMILYIREDK